MTCLISVSTLFKLVPARSAPPPPLFKMSRLAVAPDRTSAQRRPNRRSQHQAIVVMPNQPWPTKTQQPQPSTNTVEFTVLSSGSDSTLFYRPCVDCGQTIGCFCDYCEAQERMPDQRWEKGQLTPLCTTCDAMRGACHFRLYLYCTLSPFSRPQTPSPEHSSPMPSQGKE